MSEVIIGFIGVIIGVIVGLVPYFIERKERYKFEHYKNELERRLEEFKKDLEIKYEVRIKTHQEAFCWLMTLTQALFIGNKEEMLKIETDVRDWFYKNCFFLDEGSRKEFVELFNMFTKPSSIKREDYPNILDQLDKTIVAIQNGIKVEHLDILRKSENKKTN